MAHPALAQSEQANKLASETASRNGYVGSEACARCHAAIFKSFSRTAMGRSMEAFSPTALATLKLPAEVKDERLDRHFSVFEKDGKLFQREYQAAEDGTEVFSDTHELKWKIGAGENGFGGVLERDDILFQAPLSFYSRAGKWDLSPGYEFGDYGFNRPILAACSSCHSGRPNPVKNTNGRYGTPAFTQLPIGCENCHGPGAEHIRRMAIKQRGNFANVAIVNPVDLPMNLANQICMSCHELGDVRVYKEGKSYQDFRPGMALDDVVSVFMIPPKPASPPDSDHLQHYYAMTLSKCYRRSAGKMGCITCHDPHVQPTVAEVPASFNAKCMTCHTKRSCKRTPNRVERMRSAHDNGNCVSCHMPKRDIREISHSSETNHRILARPDERFPEEALQGTISGLPDLIHLDPKDSAKSDQVEPLALLQAYGELSANHREYTEQYLQLLTKLEVSDPDHEVVQEALGRRDLFGGNYQRAIEHLQHALAIGPPQASVYGDLADAASRLGNASESVDDLEKGIELDGFNPVLQKSLVVQLIALKRYADALVALQRYLDRFPQDSTMRRALQMAERLSTNQK